MNLPVGTYTFYNAYENCAHKAYHQYVAKTYPYVETPEMKWGNDVHTALEYRLTGRAQLPQNMLAAEPVCQTIDQLPQEYPQKTEYRLGMTAKGEMCDYFANEVWFRGKSDWSVRAMGSAWILDWKTGNPREEPFELETNALLLKINHMELDTIVGQYFWMKTGQIGLRYTLTRFGVTFARLQRIRGEMEALQASGQPWPKKKNPLCGWCPVVSCEHNKPARNR